MNIETLLETPEVERVDKLRVRWGYFYVSNRAIRAVLQICRQFRVQVLSLETYEMESSTLRKLEAYEVPDEPLFLPDLHTFLLFYVGGFRNCLSLLLSCPQLRTIHIHLQGKVSKKMKRILDMFHVDYALGKCLKLTECQVYNARNQAVRWETYDSGSYMQGTILANKRRLEKVRKAVIILLALRKRGAIKASRDVFAIVINMVWETRYRDIWSA